MKKWMKSSAVLFVVSVAVACGGAQDPAAYNNELMLTINENEKHITDMNAAMNAADYTKASEVRTAWEANLEKQIEKVGEIGGFNGDNTLQQAVLQGLKAYEKIVKDDYPKLIEIRSTGADDPAAETTALNNINDAFEKAANTVNEAGTAFEKQQLEN